MSDELLHFEDFKIGQKFSFGRYEVTKEEIFEFAREYDPQPHHLDEEAAKNSIMKGLGASGWHVCAMAMRMLVDGLFNKSAGAGGAGCEDARWLKPVRPGDVLRTEVEVLEKTAPRSKPDIGFVKMRWDIFSQTELVASFISTPLFKRRKRGT